MRWHQKSDQRLRDKRWWLDEVNKSTTNRINESQKEYQITKSPKNKWLRMASEKLKKRSLYF